MDGERMSGWRGGEGRGESEKNKKKKVRGCVTNCDGEHWLYHHPYYNHSDSIWSSEKKNDLCLVPLNLSLFPFPPHLHHFLPISSFDEHRTHYAYHDDDCNLHLRRQTQKAYINGFPMMSQMILLLLMVILIKEKRWRVTITIQGDYDWKERGAKGESDDDGDYDV